MAQRQPNPRAPLVAGASPAGTLIPQVILLSTLVLVTVGFWRWTEDAWDFPKGAMLTTGALLLAGWGLAVELSRLRRGGPGPWARSAMTRLRSMVRRDPLGAAMLLFLASSAISVVMSPNPGLGVYGAQGSYAGFLVACASATVYFTSRSLSRHEVWFPRVCATAGIAAGIAAAYGVIQFLGADPIQWGLIPFLRGMRRAAGTLGQPNLLGAYLIMALPLIVWLLFRSRSWGRRAGWLGIAALSVAALGMTFSRASWVALPASAIVGMLLFVWIRPAVDAAPAAVRYRFALALTGGLVVFLTVSGFVFSRTPMGSQLLARVREITSLKETGTASRVEVWRLGLRMGASKPIFGVGTDQFGLEFPEFRTPAYYRLEYGAIPATAHNVAINLFATQGILGLLAGFLIVFFALRAAWRALRGRDPTTRYAVLAAATALTAFLLWDLVNYTVAAVGTLAAILAGWLSAVAEDEATAPEAAVAPARRPAVWSLAIAGVLVVLASVPLVYTPVLAQMAKRIARDSPVRSPTHFRALMVATARAPWDGRHEHHLASSFLTVAPTMRDTAIIIGLLNQGRAAEERAIRIEPRNALFHATHGTILTQLALHQAPNVQPAEIGNAFSQALNRDPVNPDVMNQVARGLVALGQYPAARGIAVHCGELYPELAEPMAILGLIALRENRLSNAVDTLKLAIERNWRGDKIDKGRALANLSGAYIGLQRYQDARVAAEEALQNDSTLTAATRNRALAVERLAAEASAPR